MVGNEVTKGKLPFDSRHKVQTANWQVASLLSWSRHHGEEIASIRQSLGRITTLNEKLLIKSNLDKINRVTKISNQLILENLEIGIGDRTLVNITELKLDRGKVYALTGESGCGKTSLLSKIKGLKENGVWGKGTIYYPLVDNQHPKIVLLSQQEYFPLDSSLAEIISYPDLPPADDSNQKTRLLLLLKEIGLYAFSNMDSKDEKSKKKTSETPLSLASKKDWSTALSGGEKKKVLLITAMIKNPDILILDEVFNGLDPESIVTVQMMLKKYLPDSLILAVDHHAPKNNYGFYDGELHFSDGGVTLTNKIYNGL